MKEFLVFQCTEYGFYQVHPGYDFHTTTGTSHNQPQTQPQSNHRNKLPKKSEKIVILSEKVYDYPTLLIKSSSQ